MSGPAASTTRAEARAPAPEPAFPDFDRDVPAGGYAWWYVDAHSDDLAHGLTIIAFVGSVFSPYYAHARRHGRGDPHDHCALNVALYGDSGKRWALTERGRGALARTRASLAIGPSALEWDGTTLTIRIDETTAPLPSRLRGTVRVRPSALTGLSFALDSAGVHRWRPLAPCAEVAVDLDHPALHWHGRGYLDSNSGAAPLEDTLRRWHWSRAAVDDGTIVCYDVLRRDGSTAAIARRFDAEGRAHEMARPMAPAPEPLPGTRWGIARAARADAGARPALVATLEDAPFYARSVVRTTLGGSACTAMHESLDLDRFRARWVQALLPFRMPRRRRFDAAR